MFHWISEILCGEVLVLGLEVFFLVNLDGGYAMKRSESSEFPLPKLRPRALLGSSICGHLGPESQEIEDDHPLDITGWM